MFLLVAQKAIDLGCTIVKEDLALGKVIESKDISIVTKDNSRYYFHLPEAGEIETQIIYGGDERLHRGNNECSNSIIEAGYSSIREKTIYRARLFCITGYDGENGDFITRPDCLTKVYHSLVRYVKKIAPYTELTDTVERYDGSEYEWKHKEYVTKTCLDLRNDEGYKLK